MRGDFSQLYVDDPSILAVLHQQGRAIRDADLNEQMLRLLGMMKTIVDDTKVSNNKPSSVELKDEALTIKWDANKFDAVYVNGARIAFPKELEAEPSNGFKNVKSLFDDSLLASDSPVGQQLYLEVKSCAASAIQHRRYTDPALRESRTSGLRLRAVPRLWVGKKANVPQEKVPDNDHPTLTMTLKDSNLGNKTYRFELFGTEEKRQVKWSDDNASSVYTVALLDIPEDETLPEDGTPWTVQATQVQLVPNVKHSLTKDMYVEFLIPSKSSFFGNKKLLQSRPVKIVEVSGDGKITFDQAAMIELDRDANKKSNQVPVDGKSKPLAAMVIWRGLKTLEEKTKFEKFDLDIKKVPSSLRHGWGFTVEVRDDDPAGKEIEGFLHQASYFKDLGTLEEVTAPVEPAAPEPAPASVEPAPEGTEAEGTPNPDSGSSVEPASPSDAVTLDRPAPALIRDIPLKLLDLDVASTPLRQWVASADLSEAAFLSAEELTANLLDAIEVPSEQRSFFDADVKSFVEQIDAITQQLSASASQPAHV